jgi:predicted dehydrogenase/threonine dehydrogenase-like Zn-dependent dehydrogenase
MNQIFQSLSDGEVRIVEVPDPTPRSGALLIRTRHSLVSSGTERMLADFAKASWIDKARREPARVREVLARARTDGVLTTMDAVRATLDKPMAVGYCNVGVVQEAGAGLRGFHPGDRVVSNGPHADLVQVPVNLCARVPDQVSDESAAFAVLAAIGLQGVRLAQPTIGECFVVTGLGLIGLLTVQILRANGCRVLGLDFDRSRLDLAESFGADTVDLAAGEDPLAAATCFSRGRGVDGVLLTLAAKGSEPVSQAAAMCRKRGRIILVGVTGLELSRSDFYEKEITFQVSCSYGPGRYDPEYEQRGHDYPIGFVRWTEQRNFEAVLDMMATGVLDPEPLISHRFPFQDAQEAYRLLTSNEPALGILLDYPVPADVPRELQRTIRLNDPHRTEGTAAPTVSFIGAGHYTSRILIPAFRKAGARLRSIATSGGVSGAHAGRKYGFEQATTDTASVFKDPSTNVVVIATPHDSHVPLAVQALEARKHVYVEKPLAITGEGLDAVAAAFHGADQARPILMVGFNRRFAPHVVKAKQLLAAITEPKVLIMTVNAGAIPRDHWTQDPERGGGRIVGEGCHFVDLFRHLVGAPIVGWEITPLRRNGVIEDDISSFTLRFADGSHGTVHYLANGHRGVPKERLDVFCAGRVLQLDNFTRIRCWGWRGVHGARSLRQNKGHARCAAAFLEAVRSGGPPPIPFAELMEVSRISVDLAEAVRSQLNRPPTA